MFGQLFSEEDWGNLYLILQPRVAHWVFTSRIPLWVRQRNEIIEDIVQDALLKIFAYTQRVERGEVREIDSLENISAVTAYHCYVDALRRDRRLQSLTPEFEEPASASGKVDVDPSELAIDNVYYELVFIQAARWIVNFPDKQRMALLIDLANKMYFHPFRLTPLQEAFASVGIDIYIYNRPLPSGARERANHAAHLSLAYKRLALLAYMQRYTLLVA
jgi:DNA-directed RNA polymerase specialized sigma24 family protein